MNGASPSSSLEGTQDDGTLVLCLQGDIDMATVETLALSTSITSATARAPSSSTCAASPASPARAARAGRAAPRTSRAAPRSSFTRGPSAVRRIFELDRTLGLLPFARAASRRRVLTRLRAALPALHHRDFALLLAGQAVSFVGDALFPVALAFAVLDELDGSAGELGLVLAAQALPLALLILVAGVWADRLPRQRLMLVSDFGRMVVQAVIAALLLAGAAELWMLVVLVAALRRLRGVLPAGRRRADPPGRRPASTCSRRTR